MRRWPAVPEFLVICCIPGISFAAANGKYDSIPICLKGDLNFTNHLTIAQGELIATNLFRRIGIGIDWRNYPSGCPEEREPVLVRLWIRTPVDYHPGATGISWPYDGVHVEIFYDRMQGAVEESLLPTFLGHVLAHEIAHVLGGTEGHSSGVMQARFSREDIKKMKILPLRFPEPYIILMHDGIRTRHERLTEIRYRGLAGSQVAEVSLVSNDGRHGGVIRHRKAPGNGTRRFR